MRLPIDRVSVSQHERGAANNAKIGVPQWQPVRERACPGSIAHFGDNDNLLEHLVIVPREAEYGKLIVRTGIKRPDQGGMPILGKIIRRLAVTGGSDLSGVNWKPILPTIQQYIEVARECLRLEALDDEAAKFSARTKEFIDKKPRLVACAARFLRTLNNYSRLVYFDVRKVTNGQSRFRTITATRIP